VGYGFPDLRSLARIMTSSSDWKSQSVIGGYYRGVVDCGMMLEKTDSRCLCGILRYSCRGLVRRPKKEPD
jgi:hypothetical protein